VSGVPTGPSASAIAQRCLPLRRQHDGKSEAVFASKSGAISGKLSRANKSDASARRIWKECLEPSNIKTSALSCGKLSQVRSADRRILR
jgi:hypothetical protein